MADEPEDLTLRYLRRLDGKLDRIQSTLEENGPHLTRIESMSAVSRREQALDAEAVAAMQACMDALQGEIDRIKRRLDLRDA